MMPEYTHNAEKARDTTLDDEKYDVRNTRRQKLGRLLQKPTLDRTSVLVTALCNQPEAFASDLGDDQSRYLLTRVEQIVSAAHRDL